MILKLKAAVPEIECDSGCFHTDIQFQRVVKLPPPTLIDE